MKLFKRIGAALDILMNGKKVATTKLKEWKGSDVEFGAYLSSRGAGVACMNDHDKPYMFLYTDANGQVVGATSRWPGANRNYVVIQH